MHYERANTLLLRVVGGAMLRRRSHALFEQLSSSHNTTRTKTGKVVTTGLFRVQVSVAYYHMHG